MSRCVKTSEKDRPEFPTPDFYETNKLNNFPLVCPISNFYFTFFGPISNNRALMPRVNRRLKNLFSSVNCPCSSFCGMAVISSLYKWTIGVTKIIFQLLLITTLGKIFFICVIFSRSMYSFLSVPFTSATNSFNSFSSLNSSPLSPLFSVSD